MNELEGLQSTSWKTGVGKCVQGFGEGEFQKMKTLCSKAYWQD
jgi:hypothetical protein